MSGKGSVLVAMSGGVDSSVAACLLHEQGYEVLGSHMRLVHLDDVEHGCCGPAARSDAGEVARIGGFPFEIAEMTAEFEQRVIGDFVAEHEAGRTPNPCARCNGEIKFGAFLRRADVLSIDMVATGHYVRNELGDDGRRHLLRGADHAKDQSYMLHMLGQSQLTRSIFPVGDMSKAETRAHAERLGLPFVDIDLLIEATPDNARRVLDGLTAMGFYLTRHLDPAEVAKKPVTVIGDLHHVDLF
ncbi:MAG: tRNA 2-thiouridine(34) synthase MnmA, partial [Actinomycetota bacterium]